MLRAVNRCISIYIGRDDMEIHVGIFNPDAVLQLPDAL